MTFTPIAIVGRGCVLPGALNPTSLGQLSRAGKQALQRVPEGRWGIASSRIYAPAHAPRPDTTWCNRGGYVEGFEAAFDSAAFAPDDAIDTLDPVFRWLLYAGQQALIDADLATGGDRIGAVVGNLSFPTAGMARWGEQQWMTDAAPVGYAALGRPPADPRNRFMSGLPVHLLAHHLGLGGGAFALDAACASSLYAIKIACDRLQEGSADAMVAGAVNAADDLFLHVGFGALKALSPSGRSRPFHRDADGLLPAEGAALVVLERLDDALSSGRTIHGVIRGIGLSNDGRGNGFLAPSSAGQTRAMEAAYRQADLSPNDVSWIECHATGTHIGDGTEITSMLNVFGARSDRLAIGSLKANLGHLITAAGAAGLLRVLEAMRHEELPPTPNASNLHERLGDAPFDVLHSARPWQDERRIAGVSAFGFGGNNAHLIVEAPPRETKTTVSAPRVAVDRTPIAVVAMGARVASHDSAHAFADALFADEDALHQGAPGLSSATGFTSEVRVPLAGTRFPPRDLQETLPQQLALLAACSEALSALGESLDPPRSGALVGMQCDTTVARHGARWRMAEWGARWGASEDWVARARDGLAPLLGSAGVLGCMPNICANRINSHFDLQGPSYTVSSEELSGVRALELAQRDLHNRTLDVAIVGATDMCAEPAHMAAHTAVDRPRAPGDAAVVLVLERLEDARSRGHDVLAVIDDGSERALQWDSDVVERRFGHAHAASGLLQIAAAVVACARREQPSVPGATSGQAIDRAIEIHVTALGDQEARVRLRPEGHHPVAIAVATASNGPELVVAGHLPRAKLPSPPGAEAEVMNATPSLAPVSGQETTASAVTGRAAPPTPGVRIPTPASPATRTSSTPLPASASLPSATASRGGQQGIAKQLLAQRQRQLEVHQSFLREQEAAHARFVAQQQRMWRTLLGEAAPPERRTVNVDIPSASAPSLRGSDTEASSDLPPDDVAALATPETTAPPSPGEERPRGPTFDKDDLRVHAAGRISRIFGERFTQQDSHAVQVRMPRGKLLLADRVTGIDAAPGELGQGTVWTETDVRSDSWFLHHGRMPAGLMIEAGQADLFLISYMGIDFHNQGKRAYRLLGCDVTYRRSLPRPGETLRYDIHVDGHARQGDIRLFFFHYDCRIGDDIVLSVRDGQAGFFSDEDLAESDGVLWSAEDQAIDPDARCDPATVDCTRRRFDETQVAAFAAGDLFECFGPGFERAQTHTRSPGIHEGDMCFIDTIDAFDPKGGPWGRGYLRARTAIRPDRWYFDGHFENDPCMPGTLMLEGCLQMMAFYMSGMGYTLERDGWRFEPVPDHASKLRCRGQVLPNSRDLVCEIFIEEVHDGPEPVLYADLLGTVDGLKAFHARRMAVRLVPDWPSTPLARVEPNPRRAATMIDGFEFDYASLMACALGKPSDAFGPMYAPFDGTRRVARLPGPPYHFMSHIERIDGPIGGMQLGSTIAIDYDVPQTDWYFAANPGGTMPFAVLLEVVLQPCGWLASYIGSALTTDHDLSFRNLDGRGVVHVDVLANSGTLRTQTKVTQISQTGGMIIESFSLTCYLGEVLVYELDTVFGFFPKEALQHQVGLPTTDAQRAALDDTGEAFDLTTRPTCFFDGSLRLPDAPLLMLDRVRGLRLDGGAKGLGSAVGEQDVKPSQWFFKAHFFQDPVQPGSLGIEAMLQLLQLFMLHAGMHEGIASPRFEALRLGHEMTWKYRGQVIPQNRLTTTSLEIVERGRDDRGVYAVARASLWVDGKRIYEATDLAMRIVSEP